MEELAKLQNEDYKVQASFQGIDLSDSSEKSSTKEQSTAVEKEVPLFGDPDSYLTLSEEERADLTDKMMGKHKKWSSNKKA